ncbi:MAG: ABC transporter permease, partial [Planctomycetaceae bacterium]
VLLPFLVSFVIRTLAWSFILADDGIILSPLKRWGLLPQDYHVLQTTLAVVAGIAYNLLPFTILPLYVSLDRIDKRLVEAAGDLYASRAKAFWRVVFPLSLPGVFAAVLLTFIPAVGDYVNASVLGGPGSFMIGNIIESQFLTYRNYPLASALAFIVMILMLIGAVSYARVLGTEEITT